MWKKCENFWNMLNFEFQKQNFKFLFWRRRVWKFENWHHYFHVEGDVKYDDGADADEFDDADSDLIVSCQPFKSVLSDVCLGNGGKNWNFYSQKISNYKIKRENFKSKFKYFFGEKKIQISFF